MSTHRHPVLLLLIAGLAVALAGCSRQPDDGGALRADDGILAYVPADTPYVFAAVEPLPREVADRLEPHAEAVLAAYADVARETLAQATADSAGGDADEPGPAALANELIGLMNLDALRAAGLSRQSQAAFYGVGLLPVLRVELADVQAFEATVERLEDKAGHRMATATAGGRSYRYLGDADGRIVVAVLDGYLVASITPAGLSEKALAAVLGVERPGVSIAASGRLAELAEEYGYVAQGLGYVDVERIAATFIGEPSGVDAEILALAEFESGSVSEACREDIARIAGVAPRLVAGYTKISTEALSSNTVLELRSDIAAGLAALGAPVPGLGIDQGGIASFGMSIDLLAAREFYAARLAALDAEPLKCEHFADVQAAVPRGQLMLEQPVPPIVYTFRGFLMVLDDMTGFDIATQQPPESVDLKLLVATDNAEGLIAMGAMFSPEIASLELEANGKPVPLPLAQLGDQYGPAYVAMTDKALGLAVGDAAAGDLEDLLGARSVEPPPFFSAHVDAGRYYRFVGDTTALANAAAAAEGEAVSPAMEAASRRVMETFSEAFDRMSFSVTPTPRGVEIGSSVTLRERP